MRDFRFDIEEVNAVDVVQEIVEIATDSGATRSAWPIPKKGVTRTQSADMVRLAAASGSPIHVERDARIRSGGHEVQRQVLGR